VIIVHEVRLNHLCQMPVSLTLAKDLDICDMRACKLSEIHTGPNLLTVLSASPRSSDLGLSHPDG
jgi:hypothetical protein